MTPAALAFWQRVQRRARDSTPAMAAALLRAFRVLRDNLSDEDLAALIASGNADAVVAVFTDAILDRAFLPVRDRMRYATRDAVRYFVRDLPQQGKIDGVLAVGFDQLNPKVIEAIQNLEGKILDPLKADVRETVRQVVTRGLIDGDAPSRVAADLRDAIGLSPSQEKWVSNLRTELEEGRFDDAARRELIDARFNLSKIADLSETQKATRIDTIVDAYRKSAISLNAETNARTAMLDSLKEGQRLSVVDAVDKGIYDPNNLFRQWIGVGDDREREGHLIMNDEIVPWDQPYSNGDTFAGEGDPWNCRCIDRFFQGSSDEEAQAA
jgi:hypothetical protein